MSLPRSTPTAQGVDPSGVDRLLDALAAAKLEQHSLMIVRHGHVVVEGWWAPYEPDGLHLLYSLSKSFTSTAVALAVEEGLLGVDDLVTGFFPDLLPEVISPQLSRMKVRHLLSMSTGHRADTLPQLDRGNLIGSFLAVAPEEEPGTWFTYNQGATLTLSAILHRLTGERLLDYLRPRLLEPLGIEQANWQGVGPLDLGFTGLHLTTESVATFGQLYLQRGMWQGRRLVNEDWIAEATRSQVDNPREPNPDWRQGYGYQFWMSREGYRGDGAFGQFCLVLPDQDTVVAITGAVEDMQGVLDCVRRELLPGLGAFGAAPDVAGSEVLVERMRGLSLPPARGASNGTVALPWTALPSSPDDRATARITSIEQESAGWRLTIDEATVSYQVSCGDGAWVTGEAEVRPGVWLRFAASGAWQADTFVAEVALVQTPHRMTLTCRCTTGLTTLRWNVAPIVPAAASELALEDARS